ncbi:MAG: GntR family transcriptional regulator [Thermodesulfobacteriota bacterium]|nr:GntR family transcriptional regulator [Thermodesulfobacteriota bacterium]
MADNMLSFRGFESEISSGQPLEEMIYGIMKKAIIYGRIMPGERLTEASLSEELNVSRTPIREALRKLAFVKMVEIKPNKGATAAKLSPSDVEEIYTLAAILEGAAAQRAVEYMGSDDVEKMKAYQSQMKDAAIHNDYESWLDLNNRFHGTFVHKCNVPSLIELIRERIERIPYSWFFIVMRPDPLKIYMEAHEMIIKAFLKKDAELVRSLVENHITTNSQILQGYLKKIKII